MPGASCLRPWVYRVILEKISGYTAAHNHSAMGQQLHLVYTQSNIISISSLVPKHDSRGAKMGMHVLTQDDHAGRQIYR